MAIFEYKCRECGKISEFLLKSPKEPQVACTHCGSRKMDKQFSVFSPGVKQGDSKRCHGCSDDTCPHSGF
jgi:putative FmdB family regulatory protein